MSAFDQLFGQGSVKDNLEKAAVVAKIRDVVNKHSKAIKQLADKVDALERALKENEKDWWNK